MTIGHAGRPVLPAGPRRGSASALRWVADNLAVVGPDPGDAIVSIAGLLPTEPGVVTVVGQLAGPDDWAMITEVLPIAVPPGAAARLAVSGAGMTPPHGPPPAAQLAQQLDADIYAPNGQLLLVPGGGMFALDGWRWFSPDGMVRQGGRRFPRPHWESEVDTIARHPVSGVRAYAVPAGLWLFSDAPGVPDPSLDDLVLAIPADPDRVTIVLGRPGTPAPGVEAVMSMLEALDPSMVIAPYGDAAAEAMRLATLIAEHWDSPVEVATGLPTLDGEFELVSVAVDPSGETWWTPPVSRLRVAPGVPPAPLGTVSLLAGLRPTGTGSHRLNERWVVEATQFGLWVRPPYAGQHVADVRRRPWDPQRLTVLVGLPGLPLPDDVLPMLHMLLNRLPADVRGRVTFVPAELNHLLDTDTDDRPDVVLADQRSTTPRWWRRDDRLFAVLLTVDGPTGMVRTDAGDVAPGDLGEIIATHRDPDPRPVLLIASAPIAPDVEQLLADQLQSYVIARRNDGWWASAPHRVGLEPRAAALLPSGFPFTEAELAAALTPARPAVRRQPARAADHEPLLSLAPAQEPAVVAQRLREGRSGVPTVVVATEPDWRHPFRLDGRPATALELARAIADHRPGWIAGRETVWLEAGELSESSLRLLANYLGTPVGTRARAVPDAPPAAHATGWFAVPPRGADGQDLTGPYLREGHLDQERYDHGEP
ncbi:hypothetical protein [Catenuloplanes indicus]|uniref:Uncharacterized protein n=1 Tax=Catenuloplanes indicus TaxID=137267 RepID=A0AAE4B0Z0_9ACTN|nr:hypothetical protein [Catenuloplanes indicus]MDQ0370067.1 hypothetical protein [Catenuloplanes indicus]